MTARRLVLLAGCAFALSLAVVASSAGIASAGEFFVHCGFSHRMQDDPIVHPNQPGMSHWHDFFGSRDANADSNSTTMRNARTTCTSDADRAGYWHPALFVDGKSVRGTATAYYRSTPGMARHMVAFPKSLKVVAGSATATGPQPASITFWRCVGNDSTKRFRFVPRCTSSTHLAAYVLYPDCWNGTDLDSVNHKDHMAYSSGGNCPASHPVVVPRLVMRFEWNIRPRPASVKLASMGAPGNAAPAHTFHADFWNTWKQDPLRSLVRRCLVANVRCGLVRR